MNLEKILRLEKEKKENSGCGYWACDGKCDEPPRTVE